MKKFALAIACFGFVAAPAMAADLCKSVPAAEWMTKDALSAKLKTAGYEVRGIKKEDGCWEVKGKKAGKMVEDYFDPKTGELVKSK